MTSPAASSCCSLIPRLWVAPALKPSLYCRQRSQSSQQTGHYFLVLVNKKDNYCISHILKHTHQKQFYKHVMHQRLKDHLLYCRPVWRIQNVLMRIRIRIPLFKLMRIRIQNFVSYGKKQISNLLFFCSIILQNLSCVIFAVTMREEGLGVIVKV